MNDPHLWLPHVQLVGAWGSLSCAAWWCGEPELKRPAERMPSRFGPLHGPGFGAPLAVVNVSRRTSKRRMLTRLSATVRT